MNIVSGGTYSVTEDGLTIIIGLGWDDLSTGCSHSPTNATVSVTGPNSASSGSNTVVGLLPMCPSQSANKMSEAPATERATDAAPLRQVAPPVLPGFSQDELIAGRFKIVHDADG
jgi:hypothetical protein